MNDDLPVVGAPVSALSRTPVFVAPASDEVSFQELRDVLVGRWKVIVLSVLVCGGASVGVAYVMTPIFRAQVELIPADSDSSKNPMSGFSGQVGALASFAGISSGNSARDEALAVLQSRTLTDRFVTERNLLPILFEGKWDADRGRWKSDDPKKIPTLWDAYKVFTRIRTVVEDKKTGLIDIVVEWKDPKLAASWANEIVQRTNQTMRDKALAASAANVAFLQEQLGKTGVVEIRASINSLIEQELKKSMIASGSDEFSFIVIDPAVVPQEKYSPKRRVFGGIGVGVGLLLGLIIAFVRGRPTANRAPASTSR